MNSLQSELDNINQQLELLTYRKTQLDSIMAEYSDVINRVKSLVVSMEDANIEPSNLLLEIEGIIFNVEPEEQPKTSNPELVKLMALVPTVSTPEPIKTQLNEKAWRRNDTLLIGFSNKRLMNQWEKWIKNSWGDSVKTWNDETLDGFTH